MIENYENPGDLAETQPTHPDRGLESFQPIQLRRPIIPLPPQNRQPPKGHSRLWIFILSLLGVVLTYFFLPFHTNLLILGVDSGLNRGELGRTDTIVLTTVSPLRPYIGLLSIPRDLWVKIPGVGENRINTAYFFAEAAKQGSGFEAVKETIQENFNIRTDYTVILRMDGLVGVVDALNGLDITLSEPMSGYQAGVQYHFDGKNALAFVRSRAGSDDFARMKQGQIVLQAAYRKLLKPGTWSQIPDLVTTLPDLMKTNIPFWQWPRLGLAFLRAGTSGIDAHVISREMVTPFVTNQGAQVLAPKWDQIQPLIDEMFRKWW
jgi:polyisoprenyl-teichoic acid--peptidoglycan teichoic acid transferase